ncbi:hypothetical protein [Geodermatophilus sp. DSM 44513]|uniref:hypothetical protein n=1 Tax=Geodermatophilus sp. DSM 44513 TaxID=1528104 RepID=UPI001411FBAC|nr:hypothetical protein [Geodermatophilus sp. DSM 44513]WNV74105.1 hypothetical protein RTG05_14030 [Geodermatophilus sp. DSM 44513]
MSAGGRREDEDMAGMVRRLLVSGIAAKVVQEASKPHNQAKIKAFVTRLVEQNRKPGGGRGPVR